MLGKLEMLQRERGAGLPRSVRLVALYIGAWFSSATLRAQAPFITDDASVTRRGGWHVELFEQFSRLQALDRPALRQHTLVWSAMYGIIDDVEIGIDVPLIQIENAGLANAFGPGDLNFDVKFRLRDAPVAGWLPAWYGSIQFEIPTGDASNSLGSGELDLVVTLIAERSIGTSGVLRANLGAQLLGNSLTGAIGIPRRGLIVVTSLAAGLRVHPRLQLLAEYSFAQAQYTDEHDREVRAQLGGWITLREGWLVGVSYQAGWYATPLHQVQVGVAVDY